MKHKTLKDKKMIGYARVSTFEQAEEGMSIENQQKRIKAFAEMWDIDLLEIVTDLGSTGDNLERDGIQKVLKMLMNDEADGVIVYSLDRFSRNTRHILNVVDEYFKKREKILCSLSENIDTTNAIGEFMFTIFAAIAQYERARIVERINSVLEMKREKGERIGSTPLGFKTVYKDPGNKKGGKLEPVIEELIILREIVENRQAGWSYYDICYNLDNRNIKPKRGKRWWPSSIKHILGSPKTKEYLKLLEEMEKEEEESENSL